MLEVDADNQTTCSHALHLPTLLPLASGHVLQNKPALSRPWLGGLASLTHVPVSLSPLLFTLWPAVVRSYHFAPIFSSHQPLNDTPCLPILPPLASGHVLQNKPALSQPWLGGLASLTHVPVSLSPLLFTSWPVVVRSYCFAPIFSSRQPLNDMPCLPILPPLASGCVLQNKPALSRPWLGSLASFMHVPVSLSPLLFTLCSHLLFSFLQLGAAVANNGNYDGNVTMATATAVATMATVIM